MSLAFGLAFRDVNHTWLASLLCLVIEQIAVEMSSERIEIKIVHGSILDAEAQVIVNAANSLGLMGGGVAGVIKRASEV